MDWQAGTEWSLKAGCLKNGEDQQHSGPAAEVDIQPGQIGHGALAEHPSVFRPHVLHAETEQLVRHQALQTQKAGNHILQLFHCIHILCRCI